MFLSFDLFSYLVLLIFKMFVLFVSNYFILPMSPTRSSRTSAQSIPYGHFARYPTASPMSTRTTIPSLTYTELINYFDVANDQLYDLLDSDSELHCIVYGIKILQASNWTLRELQHRQEQYMLDQFEIALCRGLHGRLSPMVMQQRRTTSWAMMDGSDSRDHQPIQSLEMDDQDNCPCLRSLLECMSSPNIYAVAITPSPSSSDQPFSCDICTALRRTVINHDTPNCPQFICFVRETTQPNHFPEDCPNHPTAIIPNNVIDWRVFNPTKGIMLWRVCVFLFFSFPFPFLSDCRYTHDTRGLLFILTHTRAQTVYMLTDH